MADQKTERITTAIKAHLVFQSYSLVFSPDEIADIVAEILPSNAEVQLFINWVNRRMPASSITGQPAHTFTIGRKYGVTIMAIHASKLHFSDAHSLLDLGLAICSRAEAYSCSRAYVAHEDDRSLEVHIDWDQR